MESQCSFHLHFSAHVVLNGFSSSLANYIFNNCPSILLSRLLAELFNLGGGCLCVCVSVLYITEIFAHQYFIHSLIREDQTVILSDSQSLIYEVNLGVRQQKNS